MSIYVITIQKFFLQGEDTIALQTVARPVEPSIPVDPLSLSVLLSQVGRSVYDAL